MPADFIDHHPLLIETSAFKCAKCGAVSLDPNSLCVIQGRVKRSDWCGSPSIDMPQQTCVNRINNARYKCLRCGRIAMNRELLCQPEAIPFPK